MSLLGLDVGTTGTKAVAFDEQGKMLAQSYREYPLIHPQKDWVELDANSLWMNVKDVIKEVSLSVENDPIEAISVSSLGESIVPVNSKGEVLYNFIVTFDNRTAPQVDWWNENVGADYIFKITGMPLHPMYSVNKAMWLARNEPQVQKNVWKYLCVEDFIIYRLCGEAMIDYSLASRTMAFDVSAKCWSRDILCKADLDESLFSTPCASGTIAGNVKKDLAEELSLLSNVAVVTGGHDQACGALGAGITNDRMAVNSTGTVDVLCPAMSGCILDGPMLKNNYCCYPHTYPEMYISVAFNFSGGLLLKWYRDILCEHEVLQAAKKGIDPYTLIIEKASPEPSSQFILPHFVGAGTPLLDPQSKGAIVGLTVSTKKADLTRAILDSINYEMRYNIECMKDSGIDVDQLRVVGGGAKSSKWLQMKADVFGVKVSALEVSEAGALGAAILAGKAINRFSSLDEAVTNMVRTKREYLPNSQEHDKYQSRYDTYLSLYPAIKDINHHISKEL